MTGAVRPALPLPGPLDEDPTGQVYGIAAEPTRMLDGVVHDRADHLARAMLTSALVDVELGAYDERIVQWLMRWDVGTIATVASLLRRAWQAGVAAGRVEAAEELAAIVEWREVDALVRRLRDGGR